MGWTASSFTIVVLGSAVTALVVGFATLRERPDPMAWPLAALMFTIVAWAIPDVISFGYKELGRVVFWQRMAYPGAVCAPVMYLVVSLRYAGYERWLSRRAYVLLAVVPVTTIVIVWTDPYHGLFWQSLSLARVGAATVLLPEFGIWYWINLGYLYLVTIAALLILAAVVIRSGPIYRKQATLMFVGGLVPLGTNVITEFGVGPDPMVGLTTPALTVTGLTFALALFHLDLLEIRPVARNRLVDELDDGVVVVGPNGQIRDFNPTAGRIFEDIAVGQPADEVLPSNVVLFPNGEPVIETAAGERRFRTRSTLVTDKRGQESGRIVYLNDITEIVEREQRISVLNRVLRHNIRNELNVAFAHLEMLETQVSADSLEHVETAKRSTRRVTEFAEKARHIERTLQSSDTKIVVPAASIAERVATDAREASSDAVVQYERSESLETEASVRVVDEELFEVAIRELVKNAVVHNDQEPPRVTVRVTRDAGQVRVSVADNGPGIPEQETDALSSPTETHLEHSSGLGLWLVNWAVSLSSGTLSVTKNDPRGTVVTMTLPPASE